MATDLPERSTSQERPAAAAPSQDQGAESRRGFLGAGTLAMAGGLAAGYGTLGAYAGRFLYPAHDAPRAWMFVSTLLEFAVGASISFQTPTGAHVAIARQTDQGSADDFIALSSTCPHLGCQVHWEGGPKRFFCPCHNGAFDASGKAISGPPADARQSLPRYPLKVENGLLFIEVDVQGLPGPHSA